MENTEFPGGIGPHILESLQSTIESIPEPVRKCAKVAAAVLALGAAGAAIGATGVIITAIVIGGVAALAAAKPFIIAGLAVGAAAALAGAAVGGLIVLAGYTCYVAYRAIKGENKAPQEPINIPQQSEDYSLELIDRLIVLRGFQEKLLSEDRLQQEGIFRIVDEGNEHRSIVDSVKSKGKVDLEGKDSHSIANAYKVLIGEEILLDPISSQLKGIADKISIQELDLRGHVTLKDEQIDQLWEACGEEITKVIQNNLGLDRTILLRQLLQLLVKTEEAQKTVPENKGLSLYALASLFAPNLVKQEHLLALADGNIVDAPKKLAVLLTLIAKNQEKIWPTEPPIVVNIQFF